MYVYGACFCGLCGNVCCVVAVVEDSDILSLGVFGVRNVMEVVFYVCLVRRLCMGSVSVSSCIICCMFVSCKHHVAVLNAAFWFLYVV